MDKEDVRKAAFLKLYSNNYKKLRIFLLVLVHNNDVAEELLQETSVILWQKFDKFQEGTNFGAWARAIARNKAMEYLKDSRRKKKVFSEDFYSLIAEVAEKTADETPERTQALKRCLKALKAIDRKLLIMRYRKSISVKKISQETGRSINGLYQSYSRIFLLLRSCISKAQAKLDG